MSCLAEDDRLLFYGGMFVSYEQLHLERNEMDIIFANLGLFRNLKGVVISQHYQNTRIFMSRWPRSIERLIVCCDYYTAPFNNLPKLTELSILRHDVDLSVHAPISKQITAIAFSSLSNDSEAAISDFVNLDTLTCGVWRDLKILSSLTKLKRLFIEDLRQSSLNGLEACGNLEAIRIQNKSLSDISALGKLKNLRALHIIGGNIEDISMLADCPIEDLLIPNLSVLDFSPISEMKLLRKLSISNSLITDLSSLAGLTNLEALDIRGCTCIEDYSPLYDLPNLREIQADPQAIAKFPYELLTKLNMTRHTTPAPTFLNPSFPIPNLLGYLNQ